MNLRIFVDSLTLDEMNELSNIIHEKRIEYARHNLKPITEYQMRLVKDGRWIQAIKDYRLLYNSSLLEAKVAIDSVR